MPAIVASLARTASATAGPEAGGSAPGGTFHVTPRTPSSRGNEDPSSFFLPRVNHAVAGSTSSSTSMSSYSVRTSLALLAPSPFVASERLIVSAPSSPGDVSFSSASTAAEGATATSSRLLSRSSVSSMLVSIASARQKEDSLERRAFAADAGTKTLGENSFWGEAGGVNETRVLDAASRWGVRAAEPETRAAAGSGVGGSACSRGWRDVDGDTAEGAGVGDAGAGAGDAGGVASKDVGTGAGERGASDGRDRDGATVAVASEGAAPEAFATRIRPAPFASLSRFLIHTAKSTGAPARREEDAGAGNGRMRRRQRVYRATRRFRRGASDGSTDGSRRGSETHRSCHSSAPRTPPPAVAAAGGRSRPRTSWAPSCAVLCARRQLSNACWS